MQTLNKEMVVSGSNDSGKYNKKGPTPRKFYGKTNATRAAPIMQKSSVISNSETQMEALSPRLSVRAFRILADGLLGGQAQMISIPTSMAETTTQLTATTIRWLRAPIGHLPIFLSDPRGVDWANSLHLNQPLHPLLAPHYQQTPAHSQQLRLQHPK